MERLAEQLESAIKVRSRRPERGDSSKCVEPHPVNVVTRTRSPPRTTPPFPVKSWCAFFWPRPQSQNSAVRYSQTFSSSSMFACRNFPPFSPPWISGPQLQRRRPVSPGPPLHQLQDGQPEPLQPDARQPVLLQPGAGGPVGSQPGRKSEGSWVTWTAISDAAAFL